MNDINESPAVFSRKDVEELAEKWGGWRVEETMIFITKATDHRGLLVAIPVTRKRIEAVLEAVYGEYE